MTRRDDESIKSTMRRESNLLECKRALWVALRESAEFRQLTDTELDIYYHVTNDHQIQELFERSK